MCADISLFSSYQAVQGSSVLMGNWSHASVRGVGMIDLKFTSGGNRAVEERATCPYYQQESCERLPSVQG